MRKLEITGFKRANLGKGDAKKLRAEGNVPCVIYGGEKQVHFYAPMILFRDLVYTPEAAFVDVNIEGRIYEAILQDIQFHPVSDMILHADFLELHKGKPIKMDIPVKFHGTAPGVIKGGRLMPKVRQVKVKALPDHMPDSIDVDISGLDLGKSIKVKDLEEKDFSILNPPRVTIAIVSIPRNMRSAEEEEAAAAAEEAEEGEEDAVQAAEETSEE